MRLILLTLFNFSCSTVDNNDDDNENEFVGDNWNNGGSSGSGGGSSAGTCSDGLEVTGSFQMADTVLPIDETRESGLDFSTIHKIDVDLHEAGCISDIILEIEQGGLGCKLQLEFAATGNGNFELSDLSFTADSYCLNFDDDLEGVYTTSGSVPMLVSGVPSQVTMETGIEDSVCLDDVDFQFRSSGSLYLQGTDVEQPFELSINLSGDYWSTGSTNADCEVSHSGGGGSTGGGDGGGSIDLDAASAAPGCDYTGIVCMALTGSAFAGAPVADICAQFDEGYADQIGITSTAVDPCPQDGANGACELALAAGQEQVWFTWPTLDGAGICSANGGTYVAL